MTFNPERPFERLTNEELLALESDRAFCYEEGRSYGYEAGADAVREELVRRLQGVGHNICATARVDGNEEAVRYAVSSITELIDELRMAKGEVTE